MILRAAIVFLLVLNLGIAAWWMGGGNAVREPASAPLPADVPGLRLLSETTARPAPPAPDTAPVSAAAVAVATVLPTPVEHCLRFGPFADAAARDAARAALSAAGVAAKPRETPARSGKGWKVFLPAFASHEDARAMGEKIKAAGINDWYVMGEGAEANSIALGRYGSEDAARRREAELKAKGIAAQVVAIGDVAAQSWLDARVPANLRRDALARIAPAKDVECAVAR